ncbi:AraC family transcriptional regulator [Pseudoalteromonas denitrificans]|uniref:AraC family transcriptional regulator n=1 Tax=Pseudoalteromonas denitrificans DSM 6059 TaxID=1123010 RepID=A0A1I1L718_9GAMM|nr:AraC family transcriptional regulator [Pseudoalteromonas denitrificans]SFC68811.1 AraC family transcriptional regulator [Pseudoalteromonas denitrificans DSM 6059]
MRVSTKELYISRMVKVLNYIQANLDKDLTLSELAEQACFSTYHFHRIFSGMLGESVKELVRRLRLERAAIQLQTGALSILQIALQAGYESDMAFSRVFKARTGLLPSKFRKSTHTKYPCLAKASIRYVTNEYITSFEPFIDKELNMNVMIKQVDDIYVAFVSHTGPYQECGKAWDVLCSTLAPEGLLGGNAKMIGVSFDDPDVIAAEKLRYDACISVTRSFKPIEEVGTKTICAGKYAVITHIGPYGKLSQTYRQFFGQWLSQSDYEPANKPCFEIYLNDPESTDPEDLVTDIYIPLKG